MPGIASARARSKRVRISAIKLQRKILDTVWKYVKVGGTLIYSTCTIGAEENQYNVKWFLENYPFVLESIDPYICDELKGKTTSAGYLQLLPGIHKSVPELQCQV